MKQRMAIYGLLGLALPGAAALAQDAPAAAPAGQQPAAPGGYVTRDEYDKLKGQLDTVVKEMGQIKQQQAASQKDVDQIVEDMEKDIRENRRMIGDVQPGTTKFLLAGDADISFTVPQHGDSTFSAGFAPLFLFELDKNLLFEGGLDIAGDTGPDNTSSTTVDLTLANLTYIVNDYLYIGGGVFVVPFGNYHPHSDPSWINLLPVDPLVFGDRALAPSSETGIFAGGACPIGSTQLEYNAYVTNGPNLIVNDPTADGSLNFDDFTDLNNGKAVGGRIGFLPIPQVDVGYSIQYANPTPHGFDGNVYALLQAVDAIYKADIKPIAGTIELRGEWVWSNVSRATYDADGSQGIGPISFSNNRNGGYLQAAYRPSLVGNKVIRNFEFVARFDALYSSSDAPGGGNETRWDFGVDYWVTPSVVLKVAYEIDNVSGGESNNQFIVQCGIGL